jgi:hypothetical protein
MIYKLNPTTLTLVLAFNLRGPDMPLSLASRANGAYASTSSE